VGSWRKHPPEVVELINKFGGGRIHMQQLPVPPAPLSVGGTFMFGLLSTFSLESVGVQLAAAGATAPASGAWPVANQGQFIPFALAEPFIVRNLWIANGSVASGNFDLGIYDEALERVLSTGFVPQSGANAVQVVNVTRLRLDSGRYFFAAVFDNVTAQVFRAALSAPVVSSSMGAGTFNAVSPLPARVAGPLAVTSTVVLMGMQESRLIF